MQRALREGCAQQISIDGKGALLVQRALQSVEKVQFLLVFFAYMR